MALNTVCLWVDGDHVREGGAGGDMLLSEESNDTFVYQSLSDEVDSIRSFDAIADKLELRDLFNSLSYNGKTPVAERYLQFSVNSGTTFIQINADGAGSNSRFANLTQLMIFADTANL